MNEMQMTPTGDTANNEKKPLTRKKELSKAQKTIGGIAVAAALAGGVAQTAETATNSEIDPVEQTQEIARNVPEHLDIEGISNGDGLAVLDQTLQFSTDKVNVRTSPMVDNTVEGDNNIADTPDKRMPGSQHITVLHAIVVEDDNNPSNGRWLGFTDNDGKMYWVNENALNEAGYAVEPNTSMVVVTETNTNGIIAKPQTDPENGQEVTVGTAVRG